METASVAADLLAVLAEPTRLRIINCLAIAPLFVSDLQVILDIPQPTVSRHLKVLRTAELVRDTPIAQFVLYRLRRPRRCPWSAARSRSRCSQSGSTLRAERQQRLGAEPPDHPGAYRVRSSLRMTNRILVVDDEPDITALVAYHLAKAGYRVSTAANGPDALKAAREERPDIVVLDVMLPGVSGYDVLAEMRRREETQDVGVILLTATPGGGRPDPRLSLGADDYLTKPFSPAELALRVSALLRRLGAPAVTSGSTLTAGPIAIDRSAHRVAVDGKEHRPYRDRVQAPAHPGRAARPGAVTAAAAGNRVGGAAGYSDPHGGHARTAAAGEAGRRGRPDRDGTRVSATASAATNAGERRLELRGTAGARHHPGRGLRRVHPSSGPQSTPSATISRPTFSSRWSARPGSPPKPCRPTRRTGTRSCTS